MHEHDESLSLADLHREYFGVDESEAVAFNKDQRIVIVAQRVTPEIRPPRPLGRCKLLTRWAFEYFDQTAFSKFAETSRRGTSSAIGAPEQTSHSSYHCQPSLDTFHPKRPRHAGLEFVCVFGYDGQAYPTRSMTEWRPCTTASQVRSMLTCPSRCRSTAADRCPTLPQRHL